ncbi:hypothetical protein R8N77_09215 [Vibrio sp. 1408]|nr:hypothetical protein [Vibrio sp. 1408]
MKRGSRSVAKDVRYYVEFNGFQSLSNGKKQGKKERTFDKETNNEY